MEIVRSQKKILGVANDVVSDLPLYRCPPQLEVRLEDFELFAIDRLRVLKGISDGLSRGKKPDEIETLVTPSLLLHPTPPILFLQLSHVSLFTLLRSTICGNHI
ncbi:hypothetical protein vseg_018287 [Gypsophila vaccaria]